jgi:hypothetical protein
MKFILQLFLIGLLAYMLELFLPWYSLAIAAFAISLGLQSKSNFLAGFLGIALLWFFASWLIDNNSLSGLADRVAMILPVKKKFFLMLLSALLAGLVGGFAAMAGASLRKEKRRY